MAEMRRYNDELRRVGRLIEAIGLHPISRGKKCVSAATSAPSSNGSFAESIEPIGGHWLLQCRSMEECVEQRSPNPDPTGAEPEIEIRQVYEPDKVPDRRAREGGLNVTSARFCALGSRQMRPRRVSHVARR